MTFVGIDPQTPFMLASAVKLAVVAGYAAAGLTLPAMQHVVPGVPAYDCEMLAVQLEAAFAHEGALQNVDAEPRFPGAAHGMRYGRFAVFLVRCVPTFNSQGNPPSVVDNEAAAMTVLQDSVMVFNSVLAAQLQGLLPGCSSVSYESWAAIEPSGGLGGGTTRLRIALW